MAIRDGGWEGEARLLSFTPGSSLLVNSMPAASTLHGLNCFRNCRRRCCGPEFFSGEIEHGNLPEEKPLSPPRDKIGA
jgi:hypothetical protein